MISSVLLWKNKCLHWSKRARLPLLYLNLCSIGIQSRPLLPVPLIHKEGGTPRLGHTGAEWRFLRWPDYPVVLEPNIGFGLPCVAAEWVSGVIADRDHPASGHWPHMEACRVTHAVTYRANGYVLHTVGVFKVGSDVFYGPLFVVCRLLADFIGWHDRRTGADRHQAYKRNECLFHLYPPSRILSS